jgi:hypothetical protein
MQQELWGMQQQQQMNNNRVRQNLQERRGSAVTLQKEGQGCPAIHSVFLMAWCSNCQGQHTLCIQMHG